MKSIIFIAPPAAGKGTQSAILSEKYNIPSISTGDLLRAARNRKDEIGQIIRDKQDAGQLVDNDIVLALLKERLSNADCNNGYILDGFPRSVEQAKAYEDILMELNRELGYVIYLEIDKEIAKKRILGRLSCPSCGRIYNDMTEEMMPKNEGVCDNCNVTLTRRSDDNEETFEKRFDTYLEQTQPLINYYKNLDSLYTVNSGVDADHTFASIEEILRGSK